MKKAHLIPFFLLAVSAQLPAVKMPQSKGWSTNSNWTHIQRKIECPKKIRSSRRVTKFESTKVDDSVSWFAKKKQQALDSNLDVNVINHSSFNFKLSFGNYSQFDSKALQHYSITSHKNDMQKTVHVGVRSLPDLKIQVSTFSKKWQNLSYKKNSSINTSLVSPSSISFQVLVTGSARNEKASLNMTYKLRGAKNSGESKVVELGSFSVHNSNADTANFFKKNAGQIVGILVLVVAIVVLTTSAITMLGRKSMQLSAAGSTGDSLFGRIMPDRQVPMQLAEKDIANATDAELDRMIGILDHSTTRIDDEFVLFNESRDSRETAIRAKATNADMISKSTLWEAKRIIQQELSEYEQSVIDQVSSLKQSSLNTEKANLDLESQIQSEDERIESIEKSFIDQELKVRIERVDSVKFEAAKLKYANEDLLTATPPELSDDEIKEFTANSNLLEESKEQIKNLKEQKETLEMMSIDDEQVKVETSRILSNIEYNTQDKKQIEKVLSESKKTLARLKQQTSLINTDSSSTVLSDPLHLGSINEEIQISDTTSVLPFEIIDSNEATVGNLSGDSASSGNSELKIEKDNPSLYSSPQEIAGYTISDIEAKAGVAIPETPRIITTIDKTSDLGDLTLQATSDSHSIAIAENDENFDVTEMEKKLLSDDLAVATEDKSFFSTLRWWKK